MAAETMPIEWEVNMEVQADLHTYAGELARHIQKWYQDPAHEAAFQEWLKEKRAKEGAGS